MLLQDQLSHEQICITKYSGYASRTKDPGIRRMFHEFASDEQQHYDTIDNLIQGSGQTATQSQGQQSQSQAQQFQSQTQQFRSQGQQSQGQTTGRVTGLQAGKGFQAGSQGAGWQATGQEELTGQVGQTGHTGQVGQPGRGVQGMPGNTMQSGGQTGTTAGSQTGAYQATSGGEQNWMSDTRTVYGATKKKGRGPVDFEAGSDFNISTQDDKSMLEDMLMTEKYISGAYDTAVFETSNQQVRQALQHIQKDEQKHGEEIFKYMQQKGMYQPQ
jgi:spore coat protein CotF